MVKIISRKMWLLVIVITLMWTFAISPMSNQLEVRAQQVDETFSLVPDVNELSLGETITLSINVAATVEESIDAAQVYLDFDPNFLQVVDDDEEKNGIQIAPGPIFPLQWEDVLQNSVDNSTGQINFAGGRGINGGTAASEEFILADIVFKAIKVLLTEGTTVTFSTDKSSVRVTKAISGISNVTSEILGEATIMPSGAATATPIATATASSSSSSGGGLARVDPVIAFSPFSISFQTIAGGENPEPQILRVSTSKNRSELRFTVDSDPSWLKVSPSEGISDGPTDRKRISVSVEITGLEQGAYTGEIVISGRRADNDPQAVPVTLIVTNASKPGVISEIRVPVNVNSASEIATADQLVRVSIPQGALPNENLNYEVEIKNIEVASILAAPGETLFLRAYELNTLVNGEFHPVNYELPIEVTFVLTQDDLDSVDGDVLKLGVLWLNEDTGDWESIPVVHEPEPQPAGRLIVHLDRFSVYAIGMNETVSDPPQGITTEPPTSIPDSKSTGEVTPTSAPVTPTSAPAPPASLATQVVSTATPTLSAPTAEVVATFTPLPITPVTAVANVSPTPRSPPTVAARESSVPKTLARLSSPTADANPLSTVENDGTNSTASLIIIVVVGIAVLAGVTGVALSMRGGRREFGEGSYEDGPLR